MYYCSIYYISGDDVGKLMDALPKVPQEEALVNVYVDVQKILTYANRDSAEKFKEAAIQYASRVSTEIKEQNGYTVLFKCDYDGITVRPSGGCTVIGIETDDNRGQLKFLSISSNYAKNNFVNGTPYVQYIQKTIEEKSADGADFENRVAALRKDALDGFEKNRAEKICARDKVIAKFEKVLDGATELEDILRALVKTTASIKYEDDRDLLIKTALLKIQNSTEAPTVKRNSTDWYDQLSELNS